MIKVLSIFGTRPEAIKMAPVVQALAGCNGIDSRVLVTAQHRLMLDQVLDLFEIVPDVDLDIMQPEQSLNQITREILLRIEPVLAEFKPDWVLVCGDTATAFAGALAAFYQRIAVGHVEAGLRSGNPLKPWPEEINRKLVTTLASLHFCPTRQAQAHLTAENVAAGRTFVVGNSVIDALHWVNRKLDASPALQTELDRRFDSLRPGAKMVLITAHRRENFGPGMEQICQAIRRLALAFPAVDFVFPVHPNPQVSGPVAGQLSALPNLQLLQPQEYLPFIYLLRRCHLVLTDSGGIQEEAPSLGKPVVLMRSITERPEAVDAGTVSLVGTDVDAIVAAVSSLLTDNERYQRMSVAHNPYGDGKASERIVDIILANQRTDS
jgi:UDP-N-acetylglucosamine 2-epimerase (non-hydrolysing)